VRRPATCLMHRARTPPRQPARPCIRVAQDSASTVPETLVAVQEATPARLRPQPSPPSTSRSPIGHVGGGAAQPTTLLDPFPKRPTAAWISSWGQLHFAPTGSFRGQPQGLRRGRQDPGDGGNTVIDARLRMAQTAPKLELPASTAGSKRDPATVQPSRKTGRAAQSIGGAFLELLDRFTRDTALLLPPAPQSHRARTLRPCCGPPPARLPEPSPLGLTTGWCGRSAGAKPFVLTDSGGPWQGVAPCPGQTAVLVGCAAPPRVLSSQAPEPAKLIGTDLRRFVGEASLLLRWMAGAYFCSPLAQARNPVGATGQGGPAGAAFLGPAKAVGKFLAGTKKTNESL